jgi:hypothetical protein
MKIHTEKICFTEMTYNTVLTTPLYCNMMEEAGIAEQINATIARQWGGKLMSAAMNKHATIKKLLEAVFYIQSMPRLHGEYHQGVDSQSEIRVGR